MMHFLHLLKNRPRQEELPGESDTGLPDASSDPLARFQTTKARAITLGDSLVDRITQNLHQGDDPRLLSDIWDLLPFFIDVVATADAAQAAAAPPSREESVPTVSNYQTTPLYLITSAAYLLSQPQGKEQIYLATGLKDGGSRRTLDRLCKVALSQQSLTGATADQLDLVRCLRELDSFGMHLHALLHCHPCNGPAMTRPSGTDLKTQERYERGGYPCIGGICSRDGWFRFFAHHPFTITVFGKGVVQHEEHLFQIQKYPGCLSLQAADEQGEGCRRYDGARGSAWV